MERSFLNRKLKGQLNCSLNGSFDWGSLINTAIETGGNVYSSYMEGGSGVLFPSAQERLLQQQQQQQQQQQAPAPVKDNTLLYVGLGLGTIILLGGGLLLMNKKPNKK